MCSLLLGEGDDGGGGGGKGKDDVDVVDVDDDGDDGGKKVVGDRQQLLTQDKDMVPVTE